MGVEDLRAKLQRLYSDTPSAPPTPYQICSFLERQQFFEDLGERLGVKDIGVLQEVLHPNGKFLAHKVVALEKSLKEAAEKYGEEAVNFLCAECVRGSGELNFRKLRKRMKHNGRT